MLILDTNESVDTGEITATEHVQLRLHLRIDRRTKLMKNVIKYLNHFGTLLSLMGKLSQCVSIILILSLEYLKQIGREFKFNNVTLKTITTKMN